MKFIYFLFEQKNWNEKIIFVINFILTISKREKKIIF